MVNVLSPAKRLVSQALGNRVNRTFLPRRAANARRIKPLATSIYSLPTGVAGSDSSIGKLARSRNTCGAG